MEDVKPMMLEALSRRRGKYAQMPTDAVHKDNMSGNATQSAQNEEQEKAGQGGEPGEAPAGKTPTGMHKMPDGSMMPNAAMQGGLEENGGANEGMNSGEMNGNTDAANKIAQQVSEAEMITKALGTSNAPGLRGRVMQDARGKLDNMKAMQTK